MILKCTFPLFLIGNQENKFQNFSPLIISVESFAQGIYGRGQLNKVGKDEKQGTFPLEKARNTVKSNNLKTYFANYRALKNKKPFLPRL